MGVILLQKPDAADNFMKCKTKTIPKNIILLKSKYDLKTRYYVFKSYFDFDKIIFFRTVFIL